MEVNERLRIMELLEERPFSYLFNGEVLALKRVVGNCTVTVYKPAEKSDPDDIVSALRAASRDLNQRFLFGVQQVGVIRSGEFSGIVYATGEPVTTTLSLDVKAGRLLGVEDAENVVCQVCRGLQSLRETEPVHGRIRPYNILKTPDGWKLSGLDMASLEEQLERFGRLPEEPVYLPPENYRAGLFGEAVDTWALGICLHLGMCGRLPYGGKGGELLEQVLKNPPQVERLPGRAGTVVRALLVQEAEQRWDLQQSIDHIERPRDNDFGPGGGSQGGGGLRTSGPLSGGDEGKGGATVPTIPVIDDRPLYLRPLFFAVCLLCFIGLTVVGWKTARLPDIPQENKPPEPLYSMDFSQTQVDPDGRVITRHPQQAVAYSEVLGPGNRIEMVQINPGVFEMGTVPNEPYFEALEGPRHQVQVGGLFISRFEVTQQQWEAVASLPRISEDLPLKPSAFPGPDRPVESITWIQAKEFCARLSAKTGRLYRLPTEAEWEFACRAGTDTPFCFGETMNSALANYQATKPFAHEGKGQYRRETVSVGSLDAANYFGLMDVHGNVAEWCEDRFGEYQAEFIVDPTGAKTGNDRVVRGGSWRSYPWQCRSASRVGFHKDYRRNDIGFRIVLPRVVMVPADNR
jgi:formylglycine-generating enzyme required for sulfatase activity